MRVFPLFFLFLILFSPIYGSGLDLFVFSHLKGNESFTTEEMLLGNEKYDAVLIDGGISFIVQEKDGEFALVTDEGSIKSVLLKYYEKNGITYDLLEGVDAVPSLLSSFNTSRQPGEDDCRVLTGTDKYPCTDRLSCQQACYAVTSFCQPVALGSGWAFLDEILAFSDSTRKLDEYATQSDPLFEKFSKSKSLSDLDALLELVTDVNIETTGINQNGLFSDYSFCRPVDYDMTSILKAQKAIFDAKEKALPLLEIDETAAIMANKTKERALLGNGTEEEQSGEQKENVTDKKNVTGNEDIPKANSSAGEKNESAVPDASSPTKCAPFFALLSVIVLVLRG
jgi:hypothetical protein